MVVSQPDRPAGRRLQLRATPIAVAARERGIPVLTPARLRSDAAREELAALRSRRHRARRPTARSCPADLLRIGRRPPLNVHPSLLPRHRGAAPVAGTILAGDPEGGRDADGHDGGARRRSDRRALAGDARGKGDDAGARGAAGRHGRRGRPSGPPAVGTWRDRDRAPGRSRRDPRPSVHACRRMDRLAPAGGRDRPAGACASALARRVDDDRRPPPPRPPSPPRRGRRRRHDRRADAGGAAMRRLRRWGARARDRPAGGPPVDAGGGLATRAALASTSFSGPAVPAEALR